MAVEYADIYMQSALYQKGGFVPVLTLIFLTVARIMPIVTLAPFFGSRILPHPVKAVFCFILALAVMPRILLSVTEPIGFNSTFFFLCIKEMFIGLVMGFFLGLPFLIVSSAGVFIDHQRGAASLMTNDPTIQNQSSPIGTLYNLTLIALFFAVDGPFFVIDAILDSYDVVPPDKFLNPLFFGPQAFLREKIIKALQVFAELALQLSAPALIAILMTDTFLGVINRLAPQVQITFLGRGLKSWLAILMVCLGWVFFCDVLRKQIVLWLRDFLEMIPAFGTDTPTTPPPAPPMWPK
jgi:type III secretion protein SpaR/YscT/HrcT